MTLRTTLSGAAGLTLTLVLGSGLAACVPAQEEVEPTPTFSSEAEAFAAAEATYREYVKALNAVDLSDPETFEDVYAWTTGEANAGAREQFSRMHADGWIVDGATEITLVEPEKRSQGLTDVSISVCVDISNVTVVDQAGVSVVEADRRDVQSMRITLVPERSSPTSLLISDIDGREGAPLCEE